jgi:ABC-2 type transport system permease protein
MFSLFRGFFAIFYKEALHMRRDSMAILFALVVPIFEMIILGAAIDTNVRQVSTAVYDQSGIIENDSATEGTGDSRALIDRFRNSDTFHIYKYVHSDRELNAEMIAGRARVGIKIPYDFDRNLVRGNPAQVMVMVDGSDSSVAGQAVNVSNAIGLDESLRRVLNSGQQVPVDVRPKMMFNPDSRSPNFFLPGLMPVLLLMVSVTLTAFSIVREKERGTLEQLLVTPVRPLGLMMGKIMPYYALSLLETAIILAFMRFAFQVPIHGSILLLILLSTCYLFVNLALGMLISTRANSQSEALQAAMMTILPSIFLSGYIFPVDNMPLPFYVLSKIIPATYMMEISRGVILRGAGLEELWLKALILLGMGVAVLFVAANRFRKMIV